MRKPFLVSWKRHPPWACFTKFEFEKFFLFYIIIIIFYSTLLFFYSTLFFSKSGNIILCGDFNARLGTLDDYVHEMDGVTFPTTVLTSSIEPRKSRDIHINIGNH
jgi:hypothetical protein